MTISDDMESFIWQKIFGVVFYYRVMVTLVLLVPQDPMHLEELA